MYVNGERQDLGENFEVRYGKRENVSRAMKRLRRVKFKSAQLGRDLKKKNILIPTSLGHWAIKTNPK